jgi:hypothetical protein
MKLYFIAICLFLLQKKDESENKFKGNWINVELIKSKYSDSSIYITPRHIKISNSKFIKINYRFEQSYLKINITKSTNNQIITNVGILTFKQDTLILKSTKNGLSYFVRY